MRSTVSVLGESGGIMWKVRTEDDRFYGFHYVRFMPFTVATKPSEKNMAQVKIESPTNAKMEDILLEVDNREHGLGSLLINYVEEWLRERGIVYIWGDLSDVDRANFAKLKGFYDRNGWTFELFSADKLKEMRGSTKVGIVFKNL